MKEHTCEHEHEFALILSGVTELTPEIQDSLFEAGCDDATISIQRGACRIEFTRVAPSLKDAILSAINDVLKAGIHGVAVMQVDDCNLVTQSEIARRIRRTRQLVNQYILGQRGPGGFPAPACYLAETAPLWRWCEVSFWLDAYDMIAPGMREEAEVVAAINNNLDRIHQFCRNPRLMREVARKLEEMKPCEEVQ